MAAFSYEVGVSTLVIVAIWSLAAFFSLLIHLKHHRDSSRPISTTLAWMEVFKRHELPMLVQLLDKNHPLVEDVRDEIKELQMFTPLYVQLMHTEHLQYADTRLSCNFRLRRVQERDGWFPTTPWESKLERDTETASAWGLVGKVNELLSVRDVPVQQNSRI